jgi:cysteine desulfurase
VNHETGAVQDTAALFALARRRGAVVLMDAVQTAPRLSPSRWAPYADLVAISAHKLHCPKGSALLWRRTGLRLRPFRFGGGQEDGLFPGTENVPGIAAFAEGARLLASSLADESVVLGSLEKDFFGLCGKRGLEIVKVSPEDHIPGVFCVSLPWANDMEALMTGLARAGLCLSRFSACSDRMDGPSRVLLAMGRTPEEASCSLRIGLGRFSVREDLAALAAGLEEGRRLPRPTSPNPRP